MATRAFSRVVGKRVQKYKRGQGVSLAGSALSGESLRAISEREVRSGRREALRGVDFDYRASYSGVQASGSKRGLFGAKPVGGATGKAWPGLFSVAPVVNPSGGKGREIFPESTCGKAIHRAPVRIEARCGTEAAGCLEKQPAAPGRVPSSERGTPLLLESNRRI